MKAEDVLQQVAEGKAPLSALPWIPLMQGGNESGAIERWKELAALEPQASRRTDYAVLARTFADAVNEQAIWHHALKGWNMRESKFIKSWENVFRREQSVRSVLEVLQDKFGALPADVPVHLEAVNGLSILRSLLLGAVHAGSLEDFRKQIPNGIQNGSQRDEH